jgi:hypothetical protein
LQGKEAKREKPSRMGGEIFSKNWQHFQV